MTENGIKTIKNSKIFYFDYYTVNDISKFANGGANYATQVLINVCNACKTNQDIKLIVLCPEQFSFSNSLKEILNTCNASICRTERLEKMHFSEYSTLYFPGIVGKTLVCIKKIRKKNPTINVYGTIHDIQHNDIKFDFYDRFYFKGVHRLSFFRLIKWIIKLLEFKIIFPLLVVNVDKIFTVSNFSLQRIVNRGGKRIIPYYVDVLLKDSFTSEKISDDYILFVGGNRPQKNFFRALEAFCMLKKQNPDNLKLYVTGVSSELMNTFIDSGRIDRNIVDRYVEVFGYVSNEDYNKLFSNCKYVIYTSRCEGFGLPVLEGIMHEKPVLASYQTSIPEVAGACVKYVDAFDVNSIYNGMIQMNDEYLSFIGTKIVEKKEMIKKSISLDNDIFIYELFNK